jgi:hypothetical protein
MTLIEWYVTRASGIVAFALLTVAVILGLMLSGRTRLPAWPTFAVEDVHRFAGLLTGAFVSTHVFFLFIDAYMPFSVPAAAYPRAVGLSPARNRARDRRRRAPDRARDHEQVSQAPLVPFLAPRALPQLRGLGLRARARPRRGNRSWLTLGGDALYLLGRAGFRVPHLARGRGPGDAPYRTRRVIPAGWKPGFLAVKRTRPRLLGRSVNRATPHMLVLRV